MHQLDFPHNGCSSHASSDRIMLTADGLSSPHVREHFKRLLASVVTASKESNGPPGSRVVLVLDAAYAAYDAYIFCGLRKQELASLGASEVTCAILDPAAREDLWQRAHRNQTYGDQRYYAHGQTRKEFGDEIRTMDDDRIFEEMHRAVAIWVDVGSPLILAQQFRRPLELSVPAEGLIPQTMKGIIRAKMKTGYFAYIGASSGSSLAGKYMIDMKDSVVDSLDGDNSGLELVPNCSFFPHADGVLVNASTLQRLAEKYHTGVMAVPNCQPAIDTGSTIGHLSHACP